MEEEQDISSEGNAFAIPDLYKPSRLAQFDDAPTTGPMGGMGIEELGGPLLGKANLLLVKGGLCRLED